MLRRRLAFLVASSALVTSSCAAIFGFERLSEEGGRDAAPDAVIVPLDGGTDAAEGGRTCTELGIPAPPTDAAAGSANDVLGALRLFDFGIDVDGGRPDIPGFNLDLACSTDVATSSCTTKLLPTTFEKHLKDKSATGIDNAGFSLIETLSTYSSALSAAGINDGIAKGRYGAVIRLTHWNGQPDDDDVLLEFFPSIGFVAPDASALPAFDETDEWRLDKRFQLAGAVDGSNLRSDRAWVTNGRLVARFKEVTLPIKIDDDPRQFDIRIRDVIVSTTLDRGDAGTALRNGVLGGRWKSSDFLGEVRAIYIKNGSGFQDTTLCDSKGSLLYLGVKAEICDGRDIRADSNDNAGLPCDAISVAARIEGYRVTKLGSFANAPDAGARCVAGAVIPAGDDCQ